MTTHSEWYTKLKILGKIEEYSGIGPVLRIGKLGSCLGLQS